MASYWETKTLAEMSPSEWEGLCDGCGLCCVIRFEDEDTGEVIPTRVHCKPVSYTHLTLPTKRIV